MLAHPFARRVTIAIAVLLIASVAATPSGYADGHGQPGVNRLWSQFPLGPRLHIRRADQTRHRGTRPPAPARTGTPEAPPRGHAVKSTEGRRTTPWVWPLIGMVVLVLVSAAFSLLRPRYGAGQGVARSDIPDRPAPPRRPADARTNVAAPQGTNVAAPQGTNVAAPQKKHPWMSGGPRRLETLPRRELFEMANALGIENTVRMSREELIRALRPKAPVAGKAAADASDLELVRFAAAYTAACRSGNPAPIVAASAIAPPTTEDPARYSKQMIAEARRRGLLTSNGGRKPGGELTARSKILLRQWARDHSQSSRP
jgi:Rho termination factor-like protein